jgi:hypothetical protein
MLGHGFDSEIAQNKNMAASFDNHQSDDNLKQQQISTRQSTPTTENSIGKKVRIEIWALIEVTDIAVKISVFGRFPRHPVTCDDKHLSLRIQINST